MVGSKHAFWQALVFAVVVFLIGILFGFFLEGLRADKVSETVLNSEINFADEKLRSESLEIFNVSCSDSKASLFAFADRIYYDALALEEYDSSSKLRDTLTILHKRYDLLRMSLWEESIRLRKKCNSDFHTVVYLYNYNTKDVEERARELFFSRMLLDVKGAYPDKILLIPIAVNQNLSSVNDALVGYNLTKYPSVIVDGEDVVSEVVTIDDFENIVFKSNKQFK